MDVSLHYGDHQLTLQIPTKNLAGFIQPSYQANSTDNVDHIKQAIDVSTDKLAEETAARTVGILLPDGTRDFPIEAALSILLPQLKDARQCLFFICTGTHDGQTPANQPIIDCISINSFEIIIHDCEQSELTDIGRTSRHTSVRYNRRLDEPSVFIVLSDVKHHYFAGYSNPIKNFVPGLCAFETTEQNHSWTMDGRSVAGVHPWHPDKSRRDNPLAADQLEAMRMIVKERPVWALTTISSQKQIQWAAFGDAEKVTPQAFAQADAQNARAVKCADYMIVSPGGLPNDVDLY
ncbi:MAG: lactate racemase domain-containing protein, partial [Planctomycetota bacterium]